MRKKKIHFLERSNSHLP